MSDPVTCVDRSIKGLCWWKDCRRPLSKYKRHYCSNRCATLFTINHSWGGTREWAIKFACGMCERCRRFIAEYERDYMSRTSTPGLVLEVNHIVPLNGAPRAKTCANHQMNLEVLCHDCHVAETTRQIRARKGEVS